MRGKTIIRRTFAVAAAAAAIAVLPAPSAQASPPLPIGCIVQLAAEGLTQVGNAAWPRAWFSGRSVQYPCKPLSASLAAATTFDGADIDPTSTGSVAPSRIDRSGTRLQLAALTISPQFQRNLAVPGALFGTVAIPVSTSVHAPRWRAVLGEQADRIILGGCDSDALCRNAAFRSLSSLAAGLRTEPVDERIRKINRAVNSSIRYRTDLELYGRGDYWASFRETVLAGKGDCEDIALVKMWLLRAADVPENTMQLVLARDTRRQLDHAFLSVQVDAGVLVLDNLTDEVEPERLAGQRYQPMVSLGVGGTWIHGYRGRPS
jgi:predicted transglutaminase-like cysteine proteinase